ncbi:hypothetical protein ANCDUO_00128 [Ancylostoma duodenale]|uniref:DUF1308 domain-containing protein n=1 Tax=Ancylostoma duodenale TaxID=51022 RepID=A0A0C2E270_9BILA|nr:hypothetical protein ANCDUO_00128 [Ancylostoma duodenale]
MALKLRSLGVTVLGEEVLEDYMFFSSFDSVLLTQQAEMERKNPARKQLLSQIEGREWIICRTAHDSVRDILSTVGGESEKKRMEELFKKVRLVEDAVSEKTATLKHSDRINQRSMASFRYCSGSFACESLEHIGTRIIFGSGDHYRAVTATANKHFVSSAYHQGVSFDVILHESRALSEQKELPLNNMD